MDIGPGRARPMRGTAGTGHRAGGGGLPSIAGMTAPARPEVPPD